MPIYVTYLIQLLLIVHVLKTGRNRYWIWILIMLPMLGGVAYLVIELLPELTGGIAGQRALRSVRQVVNPGADLRRHADAWAQSPNADNARRYAEALLAGGQHEQAEQVLDTALSGFFSTEPSLLQLQAQSRFECGAPAEAVDVLETLQRENPDFHSPEGHLLYSRALEACGRVAEALEAYRSVATYFPGAEARYRLVAALAANGEREQAREEAEQVLNDARLAPAHFRKSQKTWLDHVRRELQQLEA